MRSPLRPLCASLLAIGLSGSGATAQHDPWSLVVLPDTQYYSRSHPWLFDVQTQWIADNAAALNIRYLLHEGDITNDNNFTQWANASASMAILDNAGVPYALAPGNHDYGPSGNGSNRNTFLHTYFPMSRVAAVSGFGGSFDPVRVDNTWHEFHAWGRDWLILALEFGPRDAVLAWADQVIRDHPAHQVLVVTHNYTSTQGVRMDHVHRPDLGGGPHGYGMANLPEGVNDAEEMWRKLLARHANVSMVFSGHLGGFGNRQQVLGDDGNTVTEMLSDYQNRPFGGEGYLRILEFQPDGRTVKVRTYSPWLDTHLEGGLDRFEIVPLDGHGLGGTPSARFRWDGPGNGATATVDGQSGGWALFRQKEGRLGPSVGGVGAVLADGVMIATVSENGRDHGGGRFWATAEVTQRNGFILYPDLSITTCRAGSGTATTTELVNIDVAAAFFPFAGGWTGGHVRTVATLPLRGYTVSGSPGVSVDQLKNWSTGRYRIRFQGTAPAAQGMLFAVGGGNSDNAVTAAPFDDLSGWEIAVRDGGADLNDFEQAPFSFLFLPWGTSGLIGGHVAADGSLVTSAGGFSLSRQSAGSYLLQINGAGPADGSLMLTAAGRESGLPDDTLLSYQASNGGFLIESRDLPDLALADAAFVFAFVPDDGGLAVQPVLEVSELRAGGDARIEASHFTPGAPVVVGASFSGGPTLRTPRAGILHLEQPLAQLVVVTADSAGRAEFLQPVPPSSRGKAVWFQAYDPAANRLSNAFSRTLR